MKKFVLLLALVICGCGPVEPKPKLRFQLGQVVDLRIGGEGQIIDILRHSRRPYQVRIRTEDGFDVWYLSEFELEIK